MFSMFKLFLIGISLMSTQAALALDKSYYVIPEWTTPRSVIMGGISDCENIAPYYAEYLTYL